MAVFVEVQDYGVGIIGRDRPVLHDGRLRSHIRFVTGIKNPTKVGREIAGNLHCIEVIGFLPCHRLVFQPDGLLAPCLTVKIAVSRQLAIIIGTTTDFFFIRTTVKSAKNPSQLHPEENLGSIFSQIASKIILHIAVFATMQHVI